MRFDQASKRWVKFTKPDAAGYAVELVGGRVQMLPATPLQYLRRWQTGNKLFGDDVSLLGLSYEGGAGAWRGWRLVISQGDVVGEPPSWEELERAMVDDYGLRRLPGVQSPGGYLARAYFAGRNGVFDVRPANCVRTPTGEVVPIDVIPQYFPRVDAAELARLTRPESG